MQLTSADQIALMLTSAGSQRALAEYLGISHQKLGRWLKGARMGARGQLVNVPGLQDEIAIRIAFGRYSAAVRASQKDEQLPVMTLPVNAYRLRAQQDYPPLDLRAGDPGQRVIIPHTDAMSTELLRDVLLELGRTGEYVDVSIRSQVNLLQYFRRGEAEYRGKRSSKYAEERNRARHREQLLNRIQSGVRQAVIYTPHAPIRGSGGVSGIDDTINYLHRKHEPAADAGSRLHDQILLVTTTRYVNKPQNRKGKPTRKNIRGRGAK